ncbi:hypothetical protein B4U80_02796 [Leptotrombidium deliense]|uniref:Uncharacterized protein n=1 Tax=Leptotrombidium deliense TaxID=299467 RepID=A0A443S6R0_9ACAR|nr:hypothetical protein B4U80_02796 [Leptotrombidium deliense]
MYCWSHWLLWTSLKRY